MSEDENLVELESAASVLLADRIADTTRSLARALVICSLLTLLISWRVAGTLDELNIWGLRFKAPNSQYLLRACGLILIYFVVLFAIALWRDWIAASYSSARVLTQMEAGASEIMSEQLRRIERIDELKIKSRDVADSIQAARAEEEAALRPLNEAIDELSWTRDAKALVKLTARRDEVEEQFEARIDGLAKAMTEYVNQMESVASDNTLKEQLDRLLALVQRHQKLNRTLLVAYGLLPMAAFLWAEATVIHKSVYH